VGLLAVVVFLLLLLLLFFAAAAARAAIFDPVEGLWRARTENSLPLSFEVHEGRVENVRFAYSAGPCGTFESTGPNVEPIDEIGRWKFVDGRGPKVEANFSADDRAEGYVFLPSTDFPHCPETESHFVAAPGEPPPKPVVVDTTAPKISGLRVRVDQGRAYYRLSESTEVEFLLEVRRPGRAVGQNCLPVSPSNRKHRPCSLWLPRGTTFWGPGSPGRCSARIPAGQYLPPGAYRLTMTATDPSGNVAAATRRFGVRGWGFEAGARRGTEPFQAGARVRDAGRLGHGPGRL